MRLLCNSVHSASRASGKGRESATLPPPCTWRVSDQRGSKLFSSLISATFAQEIVAIFGSFRIPQHGWTGFSKGRARVRVDALSVRISRNLRGLVLAARQHKSYLDMSDYWSVEAVHRYWAFCAVLKNAHALRSRAGLSPERLAQNNKNSGSQFHAIQINLA